MHSKLVLLLLAALQVSHSLQWERPHIRYYSRWSKGHSGYENNQRSRYEDNREDDCESRHSEDIKPVHEDQHERPPKSHVFSRKDETQYEDQSELDNSYHGSTRQDDCEIFVNPIRLPYSAPIRNLPEADTFEESQNHPVQLDHNLPIQQLLVRPGSISRPASGLPEGPGEDLSHEAPLPPVIPPLGFSAVPRGIIAPDVQTDLNRNVQLDIMAGTGPENGLRFTPGTGVAPLLPFLPSGVELPLNQPFIRPVLQPLSAPNFPPPGFCIRHRLVPVPVRVVEDCITNVPVVRKTLRHQVETVTRHVPITEKTVTHQQEKIVRHVPVAGKTLRNVVETRVRHVPVIKSRTRTVVEPYTVHIPVTIRFTRPVEDTITKTVPVQEVRTRPVVTQTTRLVPIVTTRIRPVVEQRIDTVPVKRKYLRTVVEQRVRPVVRPCQPCSIQLPLIGIPMSHISPTDIPRILLSPYADREGGADLSSDIISTGNSFGSPINGQLGSPINGELAGPNTGILSRQTNEQLTPGNSGILPMSTPVNGQLSSENCGILSSHGQLTGETPGFILRTSGHVRPDVASLDSSGAIGIRPCPHHIIPNLAPPC